ncbi:hypothetical protein GDO86_018572, partial [Hymenochirus boettgeri]
HVQVEAEEQMCYASLDLSPKKARKNRNRKVNKNDPQDSEEDQIPPNSESILSKSSIYLNSEQLTAESNAVQDLIHDDPARLYHMINKSRNNMSSVT